MSEAQDESRKEIETIFDSGLAILQYVVSIDKYCVRWRHRLYEIGNYNELELLGHITNSDRGFKLVPIIDVLSLKHNQEINNG